MVSDPAGDVLVASRRIAVVSTAPLGKYSDRQAKAIDGPALANRVRYRLPAVGGHRGAGWFDADFSGGDRALRASGPAI